MATLDVSHLKSWIGRSEDAEDFVTARQVQGYRATLAPHLFAPSVEGEAPLGLYWCLAPDMVPGPELGPDGHPARGGFLPPVPLPRRMWAGGAVELLGTLRVGDPVRRRSTILDLTLKEGRSGSLCFVTVQRDYFTPRGLAIRERQDIVYREEAKSGAPAAPPPAPPESRRAELVWRVEATPVLLFRYSALTFNGHRIHYDYPYVTEVESYPGLVVHGPLQASLMLHLAASLAGRVPARFAYRGAAPLIAGGTFEVRALKAPTGEIEVWTEDAAGQTNMSGTASF